MKNKKDSIIVTTVIISQKPVDQITDFEDSFPIQIERNKNSDVLVFPAGYYLYPQWNRDTIKDIESYVVGLLTEYQSKATICLGVDTQDGAEQMGIAIDGTGILAIGRKFHPTDGEKPYLISAQGYNTLEKGYSRFFSVKGKTFYIAVCNDIFAFHQQKIPNPGFDAIINLVHQFHPIGSGFGSGDVQFARKGFAGAAMQCRCSVFASVSFINRPVPANWPSAFQVSPYINELKYVKYSDNLLKSESQEKYDFGNEHVVCYSYKVT